MHSRAAVAAVVALTVLVGAAGPAWSSPVAGTRMVSQDGRTAVEIATNGRRSARLTVSDARSGRVRRIVRLRGDFSLDAVSPDGRTIYVVRYLSRDRAHYSVQWLSAAGSRPVLRTVVEKGEPGEEMTGSAVSRATAREWVYTLYDGAGHTPFVHALNTAERFTVCIDLEALVGRGDLGTLDLRARPARNRLDVATAAGRLLLYVDTASFEVTKAAAPPFAHRAAPARDAGEASSSMPAVLLAAVAGALAVLLGVARYRARRTPEIVQR